MPSARFDGSVLLRAGAAVLTGALCLASVFPALGQGMGMPGMGGVGGMPGGGGGAKPPPTVSPSYLFAPRNPTATVAEVRVTGNRAVPEFKTRSFIHTRAGRPFDPELVQADVHRLTASGLFQNVRTFQQESPQGVIVTFEVFERPLIGYIKFVGNKGMSDKGLLKQSNLKEGEALNLYSVEEARRKVEEYYHSKGFTQAQVSILEGNQPQDRGVVLLVNEGHKQRIWAVEFVGNSVASDGRLMTQIQSKPGYLKYLLRGSVDRAKIDEDVDRLVAYYRGLGFFRARVGRELDVDDSGQWLTLRFVIDEGPRYVIRNLSFVGFTQFEEEQLRADLNLKQGDFFNLSAMNADVKALRDLYGSKGYMFADIKADPRFREEPGELDLVYDVEEGDPYRVGQINVHIDGDHPHTRHSVILNRLSFRPHDVLNSREISDSERRLTAAQLFRTDPASGIKPTITVRPPEDNDTKAIASRSAGVRGQSPDSEPAYSAQGNVAPASQGNAFGFPPPQVLAPPPATNAPVGTWPPPLTQPVYRPYASVRPVSSAGSQFSSPPTSASAGAGAAPSYYARPLLSGASVAPSPPSPVRPW